ncbi:MAG: response regulator [Cyanobacteria bacterium]|nr:response regulator [Cyanobacteriota bacterium]MDA0866618.1 response regulator [Cyanobacteriota bacterium]
MKVLLVDDDELLVHQLVVALNAQNYVVDTAMDGIEGWSYSQATLYDLIVLDINLPQLDGISLCRRLRQADYQGAILLLSALGEKADKVAGLDAGADDYVVKPCGVEELTARMRALLRRPQTLNDTLLLWGELQLDPATREVRYGECLLELSPKEYGLLELFLRNPQQIFSASLLLERLWGFEEVPGEETVRTHIKRLRQKLKRAGVVDVIRNIYGMGYRLNVREADQPPVPPEEAAAALSVPPSASPFVPAAAARQMAIAALEQFRPVITDRLSALFTALTALSQGSLPAPQRQAARQAAHKLAGSLGMFGLPVGSEISRDLEDMLLADVPLPLVEPFREKLDALYQLLGYPPGQGPVASPPDPLGLEAQATVAVSPPVLEHQTALTLPGVIPSPPPTFTVLVIEDDPVISAQLVAESHPLAMVVVTVADPTEAYGYLAHQTPTAVLMDLALPDDPQAGLDLLQTLTQRYPMLPVVIFSVHDGLQERLQAAQYRCCAFLSKTMAPARVLETVQDIVERRQLADSQIVAVDDDPMVLAQLQEILPRWGVEVIPVDNPLQLWAVLSQVTPDLLILDVEMPQMTGIEVCQILRNDLLWQGLPILFLTARRDLETIQQIYRAGADDYIPKPFAEPELVTRLLNRLERSRLLRSLTETDPLTGLASLRQATRTINQQLALARRYGHPLCIALLSVGGVTSQGQGDLARALIKGLQEQFRGEDTIARLGKLTFLISLYGLSPERTLKRLEATLSTLRQIASRVTQLTPISPKFSGGFATAPIDGIDLDSLYHRAEIALLAAQAAPGDRVIAAS